MRFFIRILDHETDFRISNLTAIPCPGLSVASLLFPQPYLRRVHICGLPLQQDLSNITLSCPMSSDLETLHLESNGITSTPFLSCPAYFSNLKYICLENQQLILDDKPMFIFPDGLRYLSLCRCSLQNLPRPTFDGLINLQILNISNNNISSLQADIFRDLSSLLVLRIDNNALTTLDISVFQRLKLLQYLYLGGNHLNSINGGIASLPFLQVIDLSGNMLTVISTKLFRDSPMLTVISLDSNNINNIESEAFFNMTSLRALSVSHNTLTNLNSCRLFDNITKIEHLILTSNSIANIEDLQCLSHIKSLILFGNELSTIPPLRNCVNLVLLDLGKNAIHTISGEEIVPAIRLSQLYLDVNKIMRLSVLSNSSSVEFLDLSVNNLTYIPAFCFNGLQSLKALKLMFNQVVHIGAFAFPANVQYINLYDNKLSDLASITRSLRQLHTLVIGRNNLTKFNIYLPSIEYLGISDNPLANLSLQICTNMPKLRTMFLENLDIGSDEKVINDLFGSFGKVCDHRFHLSLARNRISQINTFFTSPLMVIGGVDVSHNPLKSISMLSRVIGAVEYLNFNNCSIKSIAPMAFANLPNLIYVALKGNHIQYFPPMSTGGIKYDLQNNPIVCSCHLRWLHGHPTRNSYSFTTCMDPITGSPEIFDLLPLDRLVCRHEINCPRGCVCFGMNISTVSIVNCSSQSLIAIPLSLPPDADVIYLDHNQLGELHFPRDMDKMAASQLFLQNCNVYFLEQDMFASFTSMQLIDLSYNELEALNMAVFHSLHDLKKLFFHGNRIHQIYYGAAGNAFPNLQIVTLHGNDLHVVPNSLNSVIRNTLNITLAENPWKCAAFAGPILRKWLAQHAGIVSDAAGIDCNESHLPVLDINTTTLEYAKCVNAIHTISHNHWGITAGLTVSLTLLLISLVLTYCFRDHILVLLYNNVDFLKRRRRELDVLYDVRVIYDETDERVRQWVVGELLQILEAEWSHDVFLVERDMLAGGNHAEEIAQSIRQSRRTLIVVSQNFFDNEWAQFAYQVAFQFQIENKLHRVLVTAWEPVETEKMEYNIKVYFDTKQVICRSSRRFWSVLKSKLPLGRDNVGQSPDNIRLNLLQ